MFLRSIKITLIITLVAGLSSCANYMYNQQPPMSDPEIQQESTDLNVTTDTEMPQTSAPLIAQYKWQLQREVNNLGVTTNLMTALSNNKIYLMFDAENRLSIMGLCNIVNASYKIEGASISILQPISTMRMCPDQNLMSSEQSIAQSLPLAQSWSISSSETSHGLSIQFSNGNLWFLNSAN